MSLRQFALIVVLLIVSGVEAATPDSIAPVVRSFEPIGRQKARPSFWRAAAEVMVLNAGVCAFDRYALGAVYTEVSWRSLRSNLSHGFEWDNDNFDTNLLSHPYHGSLYYNAGRSNGFNFWQSALFALGGSAMWEFGMENERPSANDIIATPFGGVVIGEVLHRTAAVVRGRGGVWRNLAALAVDPMGGVTRLLRGESWRRCQAVDDMPFDLSVSLGWRTLYTGNGTQGGPALGLRIGYGDALGTGGDPYDWFGLDLRLCYADSHMSVDRLGIVGRLAAWELPVCRSWEATIGMYQHFDYYDSQKPGSPIYFYTEPYPVPYKLGVPACMGVGWTVRHVGSAVAVEGRLHSGAVLLGGVLSEWYRNYKRNYNWGSGYTVKAGVLLDVLGGRARLEADDELYRLYSWSGYDSDYGWAAGDSQGNAAHSTFNHLEMRLDVRLWHGLRLGVTAEHYRRWSVYHTANKSSDLRAGSTQRAIALALTYAL